MSERITIVIETGTAAFVDSPTGEIARILRVMATYLEEEGTLPTPRDLNGNKVGTATITPLED